VDDLHRVVIFVGIVGMFFILFVGWFLDDVSFDVLNVVLWVFIGGGIYGVFVYFVGGLFV